MSTQPPAMTAWDERRLAVMVDTGAAVGKRQINQRQKRQKRRSEIEADLFSVGIFAFGVAFLMAICYGFYFVVSSIIEVLSRIFN